MKLYFVTQSEKFGTSMELYPRVPKSIDFENKEDDKIARICVCKNPINCIKAIQPNVFQGCNVNIYSCDIEINKVYKPTEKQVPDVAVTNELWLVENTTFILEEKILFKQGETIEDLYNKLKNFK